MMWTLFPLVGAVLQAGSAVLDKVILRMHRVDYRVYTGVGFPILFLVTGLIFLIVRPPFDTALLSGPYGLLFLASATILVAGNFLSYRALDADELQEFEVINLLRNVPVVLVQGFLFVDERDPFILAAAIVSSLAVFWSHVEHHHFRMRPKTLVLLLFVLAFAPAAAALSKVLLRVWHPVSLEFARSIALAVVFGALYGKQTPRVSRRALGMLLLTNILSASAWILVAVGYQSIGVVYTTLLFCLQPFLVYLSALFFLHERFHPKKFAAFLVVLVTIVAVQFR